MLASKNTFVYRFDSNPNILGFCFPFTKLLLTQHIWHYCSTSSETCKINILFHLHWAIPRNNLHLQHLLLKTESTSLVGGSEPFNTSERQCIIFPVQNYRSYCRESVTFGVTAERERQSLEDTLSPLSAFATKPPSSRWENCMHHKKCSQSEWSQQQYLWNTKPFYSQRIFTKPVHLKYFSWGILSQIQLAK